MKNDASFNLRLPQKQLDHLKSHANALGIGMGATARICMRIGLEALNDEKFRDEMLDSAERLGYREQP